MSLNNPFTLYVQLMPFTTVRTDGTVVPTRRLEGVRELQRIATEMYTALAEEDTITLAMPGGGQEKRLTDMSAPGFSSISDGCAVKPGFGETPPMATITGFHRPTASTAPYNPHPTKMIFHAGAAVSGPGSALYSANPVAAAYTDVTELRTAITDAFATMPSSVEYAIFRIEYCGVIYGHGGIHLP